MKLLASSIFGLTFAASALAAPTIQAASSAQQPPCAYPIGVKGSFAKVSGSLFDIDGTVGYFAGRIRAFSRKSINIF